MAKRALYVCRPLLNSAELHKWAASQGFKSALPAKEVHVTVAYSKTRFDWSDLKPQRNELHVTGRNRSVERLGDEGAVVLRFASPRLADRWQELCDAGASWDYPGYKPHVTITYEGAPRNLAKVDPYRGKLVFGPEQFSEIEPGAAEDITERKMATTTVQPNNVKIQFGRKTEREAMPVVSKAQNAAMHSAAEGKSTLGIPKKVGAEFVAGQTKGALKGLPEHVKTKADNLAKRGLISEKQHAKMMKG